MWKRFLSFMGWASTTDASDTYEVSPKQVEPTQLDTDTYVYEPKQSRFKFVSSQQVADGTMNGVTILVLVDTETKVLYMQTEKYKSGYGLALQVLLDAEGKPLLYTEPLNKGN